MLSASANEAARATAAPRCRGGTPDSPRFSEKPKLGSSVTTPTGAAKSRTIMTLGCARPRLSISLQPLSKRRRTAAEETAHEKRITIHSAAAGAAGYSKTGGVDYPVQAP